MGWNGMEWDGWLDGWLNKQDRTQWNALRPALKPDYLRSTFQVPIMGTQSVRSGMCEMS